MSSSRSEKGYGKGEQEKRRKSNSSNTDFVQKYSKEEYSRAIPTSILPQPKPRLGEYCVPVDTKPMHKKSSLTLEEYNRDVEHGYAQPQDSLFTGRGKKDEDADSDEEDDDGEVYELAKQTPEDCPVPLQKKPSPKPRKSSSVHKEQSTQLHATKNSSTSSEKSSPSKQGDSLPASAVNFDPTQDQSHAEKRRLPKKVVEIEYEVASDIRKSQPVIGLPQNPSGAPLSYPNQRASVHSVSSINYSGKESGSQKSAQSQIQSQNYPPPQSPKLLQNASGLGPSPDFGKECLYEEPWDLKAKRLKQEQEEKRLSRKNTETYEEAWDSTSRLRKLDEKLHFAHSLSTGSDAGEVYHDAVDNLLKGKQVDPRPEPANPQENPVLTNLPSQPSDTYEDAWDLKNKILEERLSKMKMQATAPAAYEEPWDNNKQQKELQDKLQRTRMAAGDKPIRVGPNLSGPVFRSISDASVDGQEAKTNFISRGRHHSVDGSNPKSKSRSSIKGQRINPAIPLINQSWFHGNISRDDAEQMLCVCKEGSFVVRISSDRKSYSLSIKSAKQNIHVQIEQSAQVDGSLRYILGKNSKEFTTIPEMIDYYTQHRVPLRGAEHITLLHPVECKWSQQS